MARLWSARYYGVARQRAGRAKTASGGPALTLFITHTRARALMARLWSARYYGVARQRAGRAKTASGGSGVLSLRHFGLVLSIPWAAWVPKNLARRKTRRLLTNRPRSSLVYQESDSKERLRVSNWIVQGLYNYAVKKTVEL